MASEITFGEAEFSFKQNEVTYHVRTEVAPNAFAHVVVSEQCEQPAMEPEGDD